MIAEKIISRLDRVRQVGANRWIAACPAHEDRSPSLSIRELDDGRILVHDFGGCGTSHVLAAIGLTLTDLFPDRIEHHVAPARDRRHWHAAREVLRSLRREVLIVAIAAENIAAGVQLDDADRERVHQAAIAIRAASEVCQ